MRRPRAAATVLLAWLAGGCLFETTPPRRQGPANQPPANPNEVVITGLVQMREADGGVRAAPGWSVLVNWYRRDATGDGQPDIFSNAVIFADHSGVYRATNASPEVVRVTVAARLCTLPELPDCCLAEFPCNDPVCTAVWNQPRPRDVAPGLQVQQNLVFRCP